MRKTKAEQFAVALVSAAKLSSSNAEIPAMLDSILMDELKIPQAVYDNFSFEHALYGSTSIQRRVSHKRGKVSVYNCFSTDDMTRCIMSSYRFVRERLGEYNEQMAAKAITDARVEQAKQYARGLNLPFKVLLSGYGTLVSTPSAGHNSPYETFKIKLEWGTNNQIVGHYVSMALGSLSNLKIPLEVALLLLKELGVELPMKEPK